MSTFAVPVPLTTTQICAGAVGCVKIVTVYLVVALSGVGNVNVPLVVSFRLSPPLSCHVMEEGPANPESEPPMVYTVPHVTCTSVTYATAVPVPFATLQF